MVALTMGKLYTRDQIHDTLGGSKQSYLPSRDRRIVCGCFATDLNPQAPDEVLVGDGPEIRDSARRLVRQGGSIPVFIKRATNQWEYVGRFRVKGHSEDPGLLRQKGQEAGRTDVTMVLNLERLAEH